MAKKSHCQLTARDHEILQSLLRDPKTADQLLRESVVYSHPFKSRIRLQVRLKQLADAGLLNRWRYFDVGDGAAPYYYKLSREGFRLAAGPDARLPTKRFLQEISPSRHRHDRALAECNIRTLVAAKTSGIRIAEFYPQDSFSLTVGDGRVIPDSTWQLVPQSGKAHNFCFEIDCSTESGVSRNGRVNTLEQKIRRYEQLHYVTGKPFRAVFVFTQSSERMQNFIDLASQTVRNRHRIIFYGITLGDYLSADEPLTSPVFTDQNGKRVSLIETDKANRVVAVPHRDDLRLVSSTVDRRCQLIGRH